MASGKLASLILKISANGTEAQAEFKKLEKQVGDFGKKMKQIGTNMSTYITAPVVAAGALAVRSASTQIQAESRLLTALKGRKDVQERLIAQAAELQQRSTYGDEEVIAQQAYLAALGLTEAQIGSTISAATQLSAALDIDLNSAVRNLAKTYSGLAGELGESIPALRELTAEEMKAGGAIAYVNDNYKGFAETAAQTEMGPVQQMMNTLGDLAEQFGAVLVPVIQKLATKLKEIAERFQQLSPRAREVITTIAAVVAAFGPLIAVVGKLAMGLKTFVALLPAVKAGLVSVSLGPLGVAIAGFTALAGALALVNKEAKSVDEFLKGQGQQRMDEAYDRAILLYNKPDISTEELKRVLQDYQGMMNAEANRYVFESGGRMSQKQMDALGVYQGTIKALREIIATREADNKVVNNSIGLIPQLEEKIKNLNEALKAATSESAIARINADIAEANKELQRLKNLQPEKVIQQVAGISTEGVDLSGLTTAPMLKKGTLLENVFGKIQGDAYAEEATKKAEQIAEANQHIAGVLTNSFTNMATALGEGIGELISGGEFNPLQAFLRLLGETLKQLGSALIAYAVTMKAVQEALKNVFSNPWITLAAGVAAIAAGTALAKVAQKPIKLATGGLAYGPTLAVVGDNPGAAADPEVVAPLSKLRNYIGGQKLELVGDISFELSGDSLKAVLNRENVRLSTLG